MRFLPLLRTLVVLATLPFAAARAQEKVVVNADNAKLHEQPSMSAPGKPVARGLALTVLERNGSWITVFDGRVQGFVHAALVVPQSPPSPQAAPTQQVPPVFQPQPVYQPTSAPQPYGMGAVGQGIKPGQVRLPGAPGYKDPTTARLLGLLFPGGEAFYTGQTSKGVFKAALGYGGLVILPSLIAQNEVDDCTDAIYNGDYDYSGCDGSNVAWIALAGWGTYVAMVIHGAATGGNAADAANRMPMYGVSPIIKPAKHGGTMLGLRVAMPTMRKR